MRTFVSHTLVIVLAVTGLLAGAALLTSASAPPYSTHDKAYYLDAATVNFVRPGLTIKVLGATIEADGTVTARVTFADPKGLPLDRDGITTPGAISCSLMIAAIPAGQQQYVSYNTRKQTSPITGNSEMQASSDSNGNWTKNADGDYNYKFNLKLPANFDKTVTHTIGAFGSRNLTEFDLGTQYDDAVFHFVPDGSPVTVTRDLIRSSSCNKCHQGMAFHGGPRKTMEVCVLCHQPQSIDPDTGNSVDMAVMIHKIHSGASLPSVKAGGKYQIIGRNQSVADYSEVVFPPDARQCQVCHEQNTGAAQAKGYYNGTRAACGSCHDDVNFATGANHADTVQTDDKECTRCHAPVGEFEFDASVDGAHVLPRLSSQLPGVVVRILDVANAKPGEHPIPVILLTDKKGNPIKASSLTRLNVLLAGPNPDYTTHSSESMLKADGNGYGVFWWGLGATIPKDAKGSWTVTVEARGEVVLMKGTSKQVTARDSAVNVQYSFSVDGAKSEPRRQVVDTNLCNQCHAGLGFHGEIRNTTQECIICHRPNATDGAKPLAHTIELAVMIHKIHRGKALTRPYTIGNTSFNDIGYPGDLRNCTACHVNNSQQLPLADNLQPVNSPYDLIPLAGKETAACLACHDSQRAAAHASLNTSPTLGQACAICHGPTADASVDRVHAH